jgi:hypothetical protein
MEDRHNGLCDCTCDSIWRGRCRNDLHSPWILFRQVEKAGAHFSMELDRLTVETILVCGRPTSGEARGNWDIED